MGLRNSTRGAVPLIYGCCELGVLGASDYGTSREALQLELWTRRSISAKLPRDRYHPARPHIPPLPIHVQARPGQRLTAPLIRDEKEQVDTARAAKPGAVTAKVPMGSSKANVSFGGSTWQVRQVIEPILTDKKAIGILEGIGSWSTHYC